MKTTTCPECGGSGEQREAAQSWDEPGAAAPVCTTCDGEGVLLMADRAVTRRELEQATAEAVLALMKGAHLIYDLRDEEQRLKRALDEYRAARGIHSETPTTP